MAAVKPFLIVLSLLLLYPCFGQQPVADSVRILDEVVIYEKTNRKVQLGITPFQELDALTIATRNPLDIAGTLNQIPGVYFMSGALNTNRITIRGVGARTPFGTDKLRMYYNDIPVTNGTGSSTLEAFDLENFSSLGVVKGPKGTAYGTALGGAIVLNTRKESSGDTRIFNRLTAGSYQLIKNNLGVVSGGEHWHTEIRLNTLNTDGYRENNQFKRTGLLWNTTLELSDKSSLSLLLNYLDYFAQIPSSLNLEDFEENPQQAAFTWSAAQGFEDNRYLLTGLSHTYEFRPGLSNTTSIFYTYLDHYEPRPFNILEEITNGFGYRTLFRGGQPSEKFSWALGSELYKDEYQWDTFENLYQENDGNGSFQGAVLSRNMEFRTQFYLFGQFLFRPSPKIQIQAGLNANQTRYDYKDLLVAGNRVDKVFKWILAPSVDFRYTAGPGSEFFVNISRGFNNPSLEETLTPDGQRNPDIQQETGMNYEIGAQLSSKDNRWNANLTFFVMDIENLLVADRVGEDQFIGRNAGSTLHRGVEFHTQYFLQLGSTTRLIPYLAYTLNAHKFVEFTDGGNDYSGNALTGVPKNRINSGIRLADTSGWFTNLNYQWVDKIPLRDQNDLFSDSFQLLDIQSGYRGQLGQKFQWEIILGVNNLFDARYARSVLINARSFGSSLPRYYYPGDDRNMYTSLKLAFEL